MTTRRTVAAAIGAAALVAGVPTAAHAHPASKQLKQTYLAAYKKADKVGDPGRNIVRHGVRVKHAHRTRSASATEVGRSLAVLRRMVATPTTTTVSTASGSLSAIAACESGGNAGAVDASGTYRGKYQFDQQTWESVGGTGDPAAAPEAEQDARAQELMAQRGTSAWPVCGS